MVWTTNARLFCSQGNLPMKALAPGAIGSGSPSSWNCPDTYLHEIALPALWAGAEAAGRPAPPLVAHVWVALSTDTAAVAMALQQALAGYARLPFYAAMFAAAGYPVPPDGSVPPGLIERLVVMGDAATVAQRLSALLDAGLDELLLTVVPRGDISAERSQQFQLVGQL